MRLEAKKVAAGEQQLFLGRAVVVDSKSGLPPDLSEPVKLRSSAAGPRRTAQQLNG